MFQGGTPLAKPLIFISFSLLTKEKDFRFRPGSPFSFDRNGIDPQVRRRADAFPPCHAGKLGFVGIAKGFPLGGRLWCGADCRGLPLGGKLSAKQTDEGAGLEQLSVHRHLIRFASLTTFPSRGRLSWVRCKLTNPNLPNSSSRAPADTRPAFNPESFKTKPPLWSVKLPQRGYLIC